ncbi:Variant-surface-glycoprotein phospholipase C [Fusarium austroafricanum]|uniref:Variant-surface-glycoprotein phospholipase C n=1 Tax=Fusarium austroafricanum TaxID=2364996 RepID=A0A8H4JRJ6_9HYPO|nr:Variant-surface-glycoprotein phospholipase C [Fusarium austroafricanum]
MGEGGSVILVNGTPYQWKRVDQGNYQMHAWDFPEVISPGSVPSTYVEFDHGVFTTRSDTSGTVSYRLEGTDFTFSVQVRDKPSNILVQLDGLEAANNPRGSQIHLGWRHDGNVTFVLSGKKGNFHTSNPPTDWMQQNRGTLGQRPLSEICILGTHDSGMALVSHSDIPRRIIDDFVLTQSTSVLGQLVNGSRYFDIRPQYSGGHLWTGHYTGKLGGRGESLESIISAVNEFTQQNAELIILNFSHTLQSDTDDWREFNDDEWRALMKELLKLNHLYVVQDKSKANDLSLLKLDDFIGNGKAAVVCVMEHHGLDLGDFATKGFYKPSQLNVRNEYSDKDDAGIMVEDQLSKMKGHMAANDKRLFLLSWTLTQQAPAWNGNLVDFVKKVDNSLVPIKKMADTCNKELFTRLLPEVGAKSFPNVVYIDYLDNRDYLSLVMAINDKVFNN